MFSGKTVMVEGGGEEIGVHVCSLGEENKLDSYEQDKDYHQ